MNHEAPMPKFRRNALWSFARSSFGFLRHWTFVILPSSVAFAHDEVQTAQYCRHIAYHAAWQKLGEDAEIHKGRRSNFQSIWHTAASAVNIKAKLTLGIFRCEIDFARRRIKSFGHHDEMM